MIQVFFLLLLLVLLLALLVNSWRQTPYGRLSARAALVLRLSPASGRELLPVNEQRAALRRMARLAGGRQVPLPEVRNLTMPLENRHIKARLYRPKTGSRLPLVLYYHGGGFRNGDLDSHDNICRRLAKKSGMAVLAVDYRRTPEDRFPAASDDAFAALVWASQNAQLLDIDPDRIAVAGDSAGGNLAAGVALRAHDEQGAHIRCQVLVYPVTDLSNLNRNSHRQFAEGFFLTLAAIESYTNDYVPNLKDRHLPLASPLLAESHADLPPALIITAAFDPLLDEGKAYAEKLEGAGVEVQYHCYPGMIHGFFGMAVFGRPGKSAVKEVADFLRKKMEE